MTKGDIVENIETREIGIILSGNHGHRGAFYEVCWTRDGHIEYTHRSKLEKTNESR